MMMRTFPEVSRPTVISGVVMGLEEKSEHVRVEDCTHVTEINEKDKLILVPFHQPDIRNSSYRLFGTCDGFGRKV